MKLRQGVHGLYLWFEPEMRLGYRVGSVVAEKRMGLRFEIGYWCRLGLGLRSVLGRVTVGASLPCQGLG